MFETFAVLVIFMMLVSVGIIFYSGYHQSSVKSKQDMQVAEKSITSSLVLIYLPELRCGGGDVKDCVDVYKLDAAPNHMDPLFYFDMLGYAKVSVSELYPGDREWVLYDKQNPSATRIIKSFVPLSLFDPVQDTYSFGVMTIEYQA